MRAFLAISQGIITIELGCHSCATKYTSELGCRSLYIYIYNMCSRLEQFVQVLPEWDGVAVDENGLALLAAASPDRMHISQVSSSSCSRIRLITYIYI
jgi:hypothetical protein